MAIYYSYKIINYFEASDAAIGTPKHEISQPCLGHYENDTINDEIGV